MTNVHWSTLYYFTDPNRTNLIKFKKKLLSYSLNTNNIISFIDISELHKTPNPLKLNLLSFSPITEFF